MLLTNHYTTPPHEPVVNNNNSNNKPPSRRPSLDPDSRTLFPLSSFRHHPYSHLDRPTPSSNSASSSRRGSLTDPALHATCSRPPLLCSSPPPSPSQRFTSAIRPSTSEHSDLNSTSSHHHPLPTSPPLHNNSLSPRQHSSLWRRDSLPSISHLTRQQPLPPTSSITHTSSSTTVTASSSPLSSSTLKDRHPLSNGMWIDEPIHHHPHHHQLASGSENIRRHSIAVSSSSNGPYYGSPLSSAGSSPRVQPQNHPSPPQHQLQQEHNNAHPLRHAGPSLTHRSSSQQQQPQQQEESMPRRGSTTMYSRSPELRVSHKLAERKRRKEMKDLFDELRDILPVDKGLKTSKWEILSKALDYISILQQRENQWNREKAELHRELASLKNF